MHEHPEALGSTKLQPSRSQVIRRDKCSQLSGRGMLAYPSSPCCFDSAVRSLNRHLFLLMRFVLTMIRTHNWKVAA